MRVFNSGNNNGPLLSHPASLFSLFILVYVVQCNRMLLSTIFQIELNSLFTLILNS